MKTKIENLSFIVLISFQFGIGTDKTYSSEAISDLKKGKYFIDKCSSRDVIPLEESDNGCVEHNYVGRINLEGLNKLLWNWIYPDSITNTGGSLTLQYGLCEAIMFEGTIKQKHGVDTSLTIYNGLSTDNAIYYPHLNTLSFNWNSYGKKITQEEFDDFVNKVDRSQLPEGIKFELK